MTPAPIARPTSPSLAAVNQAYAAYHDGRERGFAGAALRFVTWRPIRHYIAAATTPQAAYDGASRLATRILHVVPPTPHAADLAQWGISTALQPYVPAFSDYKDAVIADCELAREGTSLAAFAPKPPPQQEKDPRPDDMHAAIYARLGVLWRQISQALPRALASFAVLGPCEQSTKVLLDTNTGHTALRVALRVQRSLHQGARDTASSRMGVFLTPDVMRAVHTFAQLEGGWLQWAQCEGLMPFTETYDDGHVPDGIRDMLACYLLTLIEQTPECERDAWVALMLNENVYALATSGPRQLLAFATLRQEAVKMAIDASIAIAVPSEIVLSNG